MTWHIGSMAQKDWLHGRLMKMEISRALQLSKRGISKHGINYLESTVTVLVVRNSSQSFTTLWNRVNNPSSKITGHGLERSTSGGRGRAVWRPNLDEWVSEGYSTTVHLCFFFFGKREQVMMNTIYGREKGAEPELLSPWNAMMKGSLAK